MFLNDGKTTCTYNIQLQRTYEYYEVWMGSLWELVPDIGAMKYYYEEYTPSGVPNTPVDNTDIAIYPIPATDKIEIINDCSEAISIFITDAVGRCVTSATSVDAKATLSIGVSLLVNGVYYVRGTTTSGGVVNKTISVMR